MVFSKDRLFKADIVQKKNFYTCLSTALAQRLLGMILTNGGTNTPTHISEAFNSLYNFVYQV